MKEKRKQNFNISRKGSTLVEMIVCFALMSIFVSAAAMIIASVTNLYYQVKGETYAKQVSDIVMEKVLKEIEGAKFDTTYEYGKGSNPTINEDGTKISLYDRTDTKVDVFAQDQELLIEYAEIRSSDPDKQRNATVWRFDKGVYNQYRIRELKFVQGDKLSPSVYGLNLTEYGMTAPLPKYKQNIIVVFMTIESPKYGTYRTVRPVKMFYVPEEDTQTP